MKSTEKESRLFTIRLVVLNKVLDVEIFAPDAKLKKGEVKESISLTPYIESDRYNLVQEYSTIANERYIDYDLPHDKLVRLFFDNDIDESFCIAIQNRYSNEAPIDIAIKYDRAYLYEHRDEVLNINDYLNRETEEKYLDGLYIKKITPENQFHKADYIKSKESLEAFISSNSYVFSEQNIRDCHLFLLWLYQDYVIYNSSFLWGKTYSLNAYSLYGNAPYGWFGDDHRLDTAVMSVDYYKNKTTFSISYGLDTQLFPHKELLYISEMWEVCNGEARLIHVNYNGKHGHYYLINNETDEGVTADYLKYHDYPELLIDKYHNRVSVNLKTKELVELMTNHTLRRLANGGL